MMISAPGSLAVNPSKATHEIPETLIGLGEVGVEAPAMVVS